MAQESEDEQLDRYLQALDQVNVRQRQWFVLLVPLTSLIASLFVALSDSPNGLVVSFTLLLVALATAGLAYLQGSTLGRSGTIPTTTFQAFSDYVERRLSELERKAAALKMVEFSEDEREKVISSAIESLHKESIEPLLAEIKEGLADAEAEKKVELRVAAIKSRITQEMVDLRKRGNLNLMLGMTTTFAGLLFLGYSVVVSEKVIDYAEMVAYFLPRISLVLFVELFAYFFLRLYKQSLDEIKYFQNELTNIDSRCLALEVGMMAGDKELRKLAVQELARTERNFVLSKGQTTVELERERMANQAAVNIVNSIKKMTGR